MRRHSSGYDVLFFLAIIATLLALVAPDGGAGEPTDSQPGDFELDEVLITGERPGPAMWKVSNGDHTLWIMGTLSPLPAKMTWRSREAEAVIGRSGSGTPPAPR